MQRIVKTIVQIVHVLSFCGVMLAGALGVIYEIAGHAKFEQMLSAMGIPNGLECIWIIGASMLFLLIATYFIKAKRFTK